MSINVKKYTKDQMAKMVEEAQEAAKKTNGFMNELRRRNSELELQVCALKAKNAAMTDQIDQMNGETINKANEIANLKADAEDCLMQLKNANETLDAVSMELQRVSSEKDDLNAKIKRLDGERHYYKSRSDELDYYKRLLVIANKECARICAELEKARCEREDWAQRSIWQFNHPWRNLRAWFKRKAARHE